MTGDSSPTLAQRRQQWLEQVDAALRTHGLQGGAVVALQALADGVEDPSVLNIAASARFREGRLEEAAELLGRARTLAPNDPHVLNGLGICLRALGRPKAALEAYDSAVRIDPGMAAAHSNRGTALKDLNDPNGARGAYERAVAINPNYVEPLAGLASLDAQAGDSASARMRAERVLALAPSNVTARIALASAELQQGDLAAAADRLQALREDRALTPINRSIVLGLTGDLLDADGRPAEAFSTYAASNAELRSLNAARFEAAGTKTSLERVRQLIAWFESAEAESWREAPAAEARASDPKAHVFLVGFPRSGTTLLENVMAANSEVVSLEEKDCLGAVAEPYLDSAAGLERLARIGSAEAELGRNSYWSDVRSFGVEPRGRVFIDKMPLSSVLLPVVAKLFPNARILFARRDPRDVVLSCFRRRFGMNPSMYQLLTLDGAAGYYDAVMRLSEIYRKLLPLPQHIVRYEDLVEDPEGMGRAACDFLGLEWDQAMLAFADKARARGISTPSAAQVARGLNREGQGAWRRYRHEMAPVLPLLAAWVERFGYEAS